VLLQKTEQRKELLLRQYLSDIVHQDIINRYQIRNKRNLDRILIYYQTNVSSLHSYASIKKAFQIPTDTIADYTQALKDAFLIFEVERFHQNLKTQSRDPRKVYVADFGLRRVGARSPEADVGKLLENLVFLELKRRHAEIFYFKESQEVDFLITKNYSPRMAIQVCAYGMDTPTTRKREIAALLECMKFYKLEEGLIITMDRDEKISEQGKIITCCSALKWLMEEKQC
jgi:predicted AAA+ superfamily ATPase